MKKYLLLCTAIAWALSAGHSAPPAAHFYQKTIELVQNVPLETENTLQIPGIRHTKDVWLDIIRHAQCTLDMGFFYFALESPSNKELSADMKLIVDALKAAAQRGVSIRIINDAIKIKDPLVAGVSALQEEANISIRFIDQKNISGGVMHAKYMIADRTTTFLGSQNMDWSSLNHVRELGVRICNAKLADTITQVFEIDWELAQNPASAKNIKHKRAKNPVTQKNPIHFEHHGETITVWPAFSPPELTYKNLTSEEQTIVHLIKNAQKEVMVQVMDFSPVDAYDPKKTYYGALINALKDAGKRGVLVRMILTNWTISDENMPHIKELSQEKNIEIKLSSLAQWSGGFIPFTRVEHEKYMLIDGRTLWIGTGNWTRSYFYTSRNLGVAIESAYFGSIMKNASMRDWNGPYTELVDPNKTYVRPNIKNG